MLFISIDGRIVSRVSPRLKHHLTVIHHEGVLRQYISIRLCASPTRSGARPPTPYYSLRGAGWNLAVSGFAKSIGVILTPVP